MTKSERKEYFAKWYKKNRSKKIAYRKAHKVDDKIRHRARRKMVKKLGKSRTNNKDIHHVNGNPKDNSDGNLQVVKRYHSKVNGRQ